MPSQPLKRPSKNKKIAVLENTNVCPKANDQIYLMK